MNSAPRREEERGRRGKGERREEVRPCPRQERGTTARLPAQKAQHAHEKASIRPLRIRSPISRFPRNDESIASLGCSRNFIWVQQWFSTSCSLPRASNRGGSALWCHHRTSSHVGVWVPFGCYLSSVFVMKPHSRAVVTPPTSAAPSSRSWVAIGSHARAAARPAAKAHAHEAR